ncbi:MAG: cytochrome c3 family protein [Deltaproteobacteria bacterium]|nr:cytochrome c3 family protein [Deltaproteobacteria bacterium]
MSLIHIHHLNDIGCQDCHGETTAFHSVGKSQCFNCHGSGEEVGKRTAHQDPNPHLSVHYGADLDCDLCHHVHGKSENFCNQCHEFKFLVP